MKEAKRGKGGEICLEELRRTHPQKRGELSIQCLEFLDGFKG